MVCLLYYFTVSHSDSEGSKNQTNAKNEPQTLRDVMFGNQQKKQEKEYGSCCGSLSYRTRLLGWLICTVIGIVCMPAMEKSNDNLRLIIYFE
jgi:hypothetical protein